MEAMEAREAREAREASTHSDAAKRLRDEVHAAAAAVSLAFFPYYLEPESNIELDQINDEIVAIKYTDKI